MTCKSKKCKNYRDYYKWNNFDIRDTDNTFHLCDTDLMPSMPDDCSRCKRAYKDLFIRRTR